MEWPKPGPKPSKTKRKFNWYLEKKRKCQRCNGRGKFTNYKHQLVDPCPMCNGEGKVLLY